ncbi:MAG: nuclear transport factor 2 family protein [Actinobacteria bacterium]|nr:nuclear transport factor 2 family protein [Actinomycetota bacterium]
MKATEGIETTRDGSGRAFAAAFMARDRAAMEHALADGVALRSPIISTPFEGKREVMHVLEVVRDCFDELEQVDHIEEGDTIVLSFAARLGRQPLRGVDILRLDGDGRVRELSIHVRPLIGLTELSAAIAGSLSRPRGRLWAVVARALVMPLLAIGRITDRIAARLVLGRYRPTW